MNRQRLEAAKYSDNFILKKYDILLAFFFFVTFLLIGFIALKTILSLKHRNVGMLIRMHIATSVYE